MSESPITLRDKAGRVTFEGTQSPGGGSQPLGVSVTVVGVATTGPQTITTLAAGEIATLGFSALTFSVGDIGVVFGKLSDLVAAEANDPVPVQNAALAFFDSDLYKGQAFAPINGAWDVDPAVTRVLTGGPLVAAFLTASGGFVVDSAPGVWQASHAFASRAWIVDSNDHLQICTTAGTSKSGAHPVWATDGSTTTDGTAEWTDAGPLPTDGSADVVVTLATPS